MGTITLMVMIAGAHWLIWIPLSFITASMLMYTLKNFHDGSALKYTNYTDTSSLQNNLHDAIVLNGIDTPPHHPYAKVGSNITNLVSWIIEYKIDFEQINNALFCPECGIDEENDTRNIYINKTDYPNSHPRLKDVKLKPHLCELCLNPLIDLNIILDNEEFKKTISEIKNTQEKIPLDESSSEFRSSESRGTEMQEEFPSERPDYSKEGGSKGKSNEVHIPALDQEPIQLESSIEDNPADNSSSNTKPFGSADTFEKLGSLRDRGILTDEEFQKEKEKIKLEHEAQLRDRGTLTDEEFQKRKDIILKKYDGDNVKKEDQPNVEKEKKEDGQAEQPTPQKEHFSLPERKLDSVQKKEIRKEYANLNERKSDLAREKEKAGRRKEYANLNERRLELEKVKRDENWEMMYQKLIQYKKRHGNCKVPVGWKEEPALHGWVLYQRTLKKKDKLSEDKVQWLEEIGFEWTP